MVSSAPTTGQLGHSMRDCARLRRMYSSLSSPKASFWRRSMPKPLTSRMPAKFSCAKLDRIENCSCEAA